MEGGIITLHEIIKICFLAAKTPQMKLGFDTLLV